MKYLAIARPRVHPAPPEEDRVKFLEDCRDYITEYKEKGKIIDVFWTYGNDFVTNYWFLECDSHEEMWRVLSKWPGGNRDGGFEYEVCPLVSSEAFFEQGVGGAKKRVEEGST